MTGLRTLACAFLLAAGLPACNDQPGLPAAEHEVQVRTDSFFPATLEITAGERVRWQNILRKGTDSRRTVTSGTGPDAPHAGDRFDVTLDGYGSGDRFGETYVLRFDAPDTVFYFSRLPAGREFAGRVIVR